MWICPECGRHNSEEYCSGCGKRREPCSKSESAISSTRWTIRDLAIILLTIVGAIFLLTTSLVKIPYLEEYIKLNNLAFGNWNDYINLSTVFQYFEKAGWILLLMKVSAVALYAAIAVSLVETVKKLTTISQILRWTSLGIGLLLVVTMIWIKAKINQDAIASLIAGNLKYGFGGILLGLLFLGAAVFLSFRKDLFDVKVYEFGDAVPIKTKEEAALRAESDYDTVRHTFSFDPISITPKKSSRSYVAGAKNGGEFYDTRDIFFEEESGSAPSVGRSEKTETPGKLKSTLRTHSSKPFENDEAASHFKRPNDL